MRRQVRVRQHLRNSLNRARDAGRSVLELPPVLYRHAAPGRYGGTRRALQAQVRHEVAVARREAFSVAFGLNFEPIIRAASRGHNAMDGLLEKVSAIAERFDEIEGKLG